MTNQPPAQSTEDEARRLAEWGDFDMETVDWGAMLGHLHARNVAITDLLAALSDMEAQLDVALVQRNNATHHAADWCRRAERAEAQLAEAREALRQALAAQPPSEASGSIADRARHPLPRHPECRGMRRLLRWFARLAQDFGVWLDESSWR